MGNDRMIRFSWWRQLVDAETMAAAGKRRPDAEKKNGKREKKKFKSPLGCVRDESDSGDACHSSRSEPLSRRETDGGVSAQEGCRPGARSATKHQHPAGRACG